MAGERVARIAALRVASVGWAGELRGVEGYRFAIASSVLASGSGKARPLFSARRMMP